MFGALRSTLKTAFETYVPRTLHRLRVLRHTSWRLYEAELEIVGALVRPGSDGVDVGANTGLFSQRIARFARHCYCFEPQPQLAAYLGKVLPSNCTVINAALSDAPGETGIHIPWHGGRYDEGLASIDAAKIPQFARARVVPVVLDTLDRAVTTCVSFINIDVEGHELRVLSGGAALLRAQRPAVLVEIEARHNAGSFAEVTTLFAELRYSGFFYRAHALHSVAGFDPKRHQDLRALGSDAYINNFLFLPDEAPRPVLA